ncbi:hypothetical protein ACEPAH_7961 [Sanghuangporus vaninii]
MSVERQDGDLYLSVPVNSVIMEDLSNIIYKWNKVCLKVEEAWTSNVGETPVDVLILGRECIVQGAALEYL